MRLIRVAGIAALGCVAACSSSTGYNYSSSGGGGTPGPKQVFMQSSAFNPATRTVAVGDTVTWVNQDGYTHTVVYSSGPGTSFNSGNIVGSASFQHIFSAAGTYQYYCMIHGTATTGMRGTVVVQ